MSTIQDLEAAFNGESNARVKYLAFAVRADEEGYGAVASLFRAAAFAEEIHAKNHAKVLESMGGQAKADIATPTVGTTAENLAAGVKGEVYERDVMYPTFLKAAVGNKQATRTFQWALEAEAGHATMYQNALDHLEAWRGPARKFWVCAACGLTLDAEPTADCPVCGLKKEKFVVVQ